MTPFEEFEKMIPRCECHCGQCCTCDRPLHVISVDKSLVKELGWRNLLPYLQIMRIQGAQTAYKEH
jgi:hypothetical protein